jgi:hypothetical protein
VQERVLGAGAYDDYAFSGVANTPILFVLEGEGYTSSEVQVLDNLGEVLAKGSAANKNYPVSFPFTPQETGEYTLRIVIEGVEKYKLTAKYVAGNPSQRTMPLDTLTINTVIEGALATDAYNDYSFTGVATVPLVFRLNKEGYLRADLQIIDSSGNVIAESYTPDANASIELPFTPQGDGNYTLRVYVTEAVGNYKLMVTNK